MALFGNPSPLERRRAPPKVNKSTCNKVNNLSGRHIETSDHAFDSIITREVIDIGVKNTNIEAQSKQQDWKHTDAVEIRAFIGLLISAGIEKSSKRYYREFFDPLRGHPIFRATIGFKRLQSLLRYIRFDDKTTRTDRRLRDKLAPIRDVFEIVNKNLKRIYSPGPCMTVDEQLIPFRGRCPFKQCIPSKPDKYGMKIFWLCDAVTAYPLNGFPYLGKNRNESRATGIAHSIVRELCKPYERTNRNVKMDNFFTSFELAQELLGNGLTIVGTVRKNKKFIPPEFQASRSREVGSNLFGFREKFTIMSHVPKQSKSVVLLSTLHHSASANSDGKAEINTYYNGTKGGVDLLDQMSHTYVCHTHANVEPTDGLWHFS